MFYKRPPMRTKRNIYPSRQSSPVKIAESDILREVEKIPLPNETERSHRSVIDTEETRGFPPINILGHSISLDEIIIIGLIFLLLQEQIEDEFLLILLVYILLV